MAYDRVNWEDSPSTATPITAENLNKMDSGIYSANENVGWLWEDVNALNTNTGAGKNSGYNNRSLAQRMDSAEGHISDFERRISNNEDHIKRTDPIILAQWSNDYATSDFKSGQKEINNHDIYNYSYIEIYGFNRHGTIIMAGVIPSNNDQYPASCTLEETAYTYDSESIWRDNPGKFQQVESMFCSVYIKNHEIGINDNWTLWSEYSQEADNGIYNQTKSGIKWDNPIAVYRLVGYYPK